MRPWYEEFARLFTLATFDHRGTGDSQRSVDDVSMAAQIDDMTAVVEALGYGRFNLVGHGHGGAVAATYAARHPDRVERLVLTSTCPRYEGIIHPQAVDSFMQLIETDWLMALRALLEETSWKYASFETRREAYRELGRALAPSDTAKYIRFTSGLDISEELPRIAAPTLVLQGSAPRRVIDGARETAALIPDARFVQVHEDSDDAETRVHLALIKEFLGAVPQTNSGEGAHGTAVILFADIAESTALTERMGDERFRAAARSLETSARAAIEEASGTALDGKLLGDGVMAVFSSASHAIGAALECVRISEHGELRLHLGIHAGDVIREPGNVYGGAVNIAARVADASEPGEVLVSSTVRELARTSSDVIFEDRGERHLKGVGEPVRVFAALTTDPTRSVR
jgi:class 3 adenylate cyclase